MSNHSSTKQRRLARATKRGLVLDSTSRATHDLSITHRLVTGLAIHQRNRQEALRDTHTN